ncbi:MAG: BON domain-containing protein [Bryobacterales bacterium]|nr:BON domain-containing protein [Bryobacterales bacterium]
MDDRIYDQVRLKLVNHPDVKGGAIEVKVADGVVTLQGKVRTEKGRQKAESLTQKVKGVKKVVNEIQVTNL